MVEYNATEHILNAKLQTLVGIRTVQVVAKIIHMSFE